MGRAGILEIFDLAGTTPDATHLETGEPGFPTLPNVLRRLIGRVGRGRVKQVRVVDFRNADSEWREQLSWRVCEHNPHG